MNEVLCAGVIGEFVSHRVVNIADAESEEEGLWNTAEGRVCEEKEEETRRKERRYFLYGEQCRSMQHSIE